jgi:hypothetical protein
MARPGKRKTKNSPNTAGSAEQLQAIEAKGINDPIKKKKKRSPIPSPKQT